MNKNYERYLRDEEFRRSIQRAASRERSAVVHALLGALRTAFRTAVQRPKLRRSRMIHRSAFG